MSSLRFFSFVVLAVAVTVSAFILGFNGGDYQKQSASAKSSQIWSAVQKDNGQAGSWPSGLSIAQIFVEDMNPTFDYAADDFPSQYFGLATRHKLIHSVGVIAKIKWVPVGDHPYTGLFTGSTNGFVRLSAAKEPSATELAPGAAFKFPRTGVKSANFMAMYSLIGSNSGNFFAHDFTNHVPRPANADAPIPLKLLGDKFGTASEWPTFLGLSDFARFGEDGNEVQTPIFPFRLIFQHAKRVRNLFPSTPFNSYMSQLPKVTTGILYDIFAEDQPNTEPVKIGEIHLTSKLVPSKFADETLFFQHQRFEDDLKFRPEWSDASYNIINAQTNAASSYVFPDLPQ